MFRRVEDSLRISQRADRARIVKWTAIRQPQIGALVLLVAVVLVTLSQASLAAPIGAARAGKVAQGWLRLNARPLAAELGSRVSRVETFSDEKGQPTYHVVYLEPTGFVIVAGDDEVEPIIAFVVADSYDPSPDNPLGALVGLDLPARVAAARQAAGVKASPPKSNGQADTARAASRAKWQRLAGELLATATTPPPLTVINDMRVPPLAQSTWNQAGGIYNYYTPKNYPCGCVATAIAQLLRFFQYPIAGIGVRSNTINVDGVGQTAYTRGGDGAGGPYNWSDMPLVPDWSTLTTAQIQAIGALCYDVGVAVQMSYASSSGASVSNCRTALVNFFRYSNAIDGWPSSDAGRNSMLNPCLDAGLPCTMAVNPGSGGGHYILADGYGYHLGTLYHHVNMGWGGYNNVWFNLPNMQPDFTRVYECTYNIFTSGTGEIVSGRVADPAGRAMPGATVQVQQTGGNTWTISPNARGTYLLYQVPSNTTFTLTPGAIGYTFSPRTVTTGRSANGAATAGNVWTDLVGTPTGASMWIDPPIDFTSGGLGSGHPFSPSSTVYTVHNIGVQPMDWTVAVTQPWLTLSKTFGTLAPGASDTVTVSINGNADGFGVGTYNDTITFTNTTNGNGNLTCAAVLTVPAATLSVAPPSMLISTGNAGGPFTPSSLTYTLTNSGGEPLQWAAGATMSWVTISKTAGTLDLGASDTVTISIDSDANSLAAGTYFNTVSFTNTTSGIGNTARPIKLTVAAVGVLEVTPAAGLTSGGFVGGPFSPNSQAYTIRNSGGAGLNWMAGATQPWLTLSKTAGTLAAGATDTVTVSISINANGLAGGKYSDAVTFTNTTTGKGSTTRPVSLMVVIPGDVDGDGHVDVVDLLYLVDAFGSVTGDSTYNLACDFNADGGVDVVDLLIMVDNFGKY